MKKKDLFDFMMNNADNNELNKMVNKAKKYFSNSNEDLVEQIKQIQETEGISTEDFIRVSELVSDFLDEEQREKLNQIIQLLKQ